MTAYYNEIDPFAAAWLRELIAEGLLPAGDVDERSIEDVRPSDLDRYTQCHFFAGIGGWAYALRLVGWPDDRHVWTGSCPCQPFSSAGQGRGIEDERHLWPAFRWLIAKCRPAMVFGEQVASNAGREWLTGVRTDLEGMGYRFGGADLCAAGVGAPHIRQRLWWMAQDPECVGRGGWGDGDPAWHDGEVQAEGLRDACWSDSILWPCRDGVSRRVPAVRLADSEASEWRRVGAQYSRRWGEEAGGSGREACDVPGGERLGPESEVLGVADGVSEKLVRLWGLCDQEAHPLAPRTAGRNALLRGYGNAIVPQVAAEFISACVEAVDALETGGE